ncbi:hypothetical protein TWF281_001377 [Arthrobotrys megalospora]
MQSTPLSSMLDGERLAIGHAIWGWGYCDECKLKPEINCSSLICAAYIHKKLPFFFRYYRNLVTAYDRGRPVGVIAALTTHDDLSNLIQLMREAPELAKNELMRIAFPERPDRTNVSIPEQEKALNLAANIITMTSCVPSHQSILLLEQGRLQLPWQSNLSLGAFFTTVFPMPDTENPYSGAIDASIKHALSAKKLKRIARIQLVPTDDLSSHLKFDKRDGIVHVFHHCGFLKENLRVTRDRGSQLSVADYLKLGCIPRQLALETLDTIQRILFPLADAESKTLISSLISTSYWDPECEKIPSTLYLGPEEVDVRYHYFGNRLLELYEEVSDPGPQTTMGKWLDRKKSSRHVMMATLTGVVIAIILGILTLGVSGYQAWLGYQQWQHPKEGN